MCLLLCNELVCFPRCHWFILERGGGQVFEFTYIPLTIEKSSLFRNQCFCLCIFSKWRPKLEKTGIITVRSNRMWRCFSKSPNSSTSVPKWLNIKRQRTWTLSCYDFKFYLVLTEIPVASDPNLGKSAAFVSVSTKSGCFRATFTSGATQNQQDQQQPKRLSFYLFLSQQLFYYGVLSRLLINNPHCLSCP